MTEKNQTQKSSESMTASQQRISRLKLVIIISMSIGPILAAYIVFFNFPGVAPTSRTNEGVLINPPVQAGTVIAANEKWTLLMPVGHECDKVCEEVLYLSRQIHISLGKNTPRVQRVIITRGDLSTAFAAFLKEEHGNTRIQNIQNSELSDQLDQVIGAATMSSIVFLMDPNGNVMMYYPPEKGGKPMLKDLKLLLKLSNIG